VALAGLKRLEAGAGRRWWGRNTGEATAAATTEPGVVRVVDMHTEGEPLRVVVGGLEREVPPDLEGDMLARRRYMQRHCDHLRTALMWEPRGHRYTTVLLTHFVVLSRLG
jgi:hypothetical protein